MRQPASNFGVAHMQETMNTQHSSLYLFLSLYIYININKYIYCIYIVYMWQMSSVFSHESAQRNDAGHLIDKNVFKTTRSFGYQLFRVSTLQANATKHGKINFKPMNRS